MLSTAKMREIKIAHRVTAETQYRRMTSFASNWGLDERPEPTTSVPFSLRCYVALNRQNERNQNRSPRRKRKARRWPLRPLSDSVFDYSKVASRAAGAGRPLERRPARFGSYRKRKA